jgi:hypothetical protein
MPLVVIRSIVWSTVIHAIWGCLDKNKIHYYYCNNTDGLRPLFITIAYRLRIAWRELLLDILRAYCYVEVRYENFVKGAKKMSNRKAEESCLSLPKSQKMTNINLKCIMIFTMP